MFGWCALAQVGVQASGSLLFLRGSVRRDAYLCVVRSVPSARPGAWTPSPPATKAPDDSKLTHAQAQVASLPN